MRQLRVVPNECPWRSPRASDEARPRLGVCAETDCLHLMTEEEERVALRNLRDRTRIRVLKMPENPTLSRLLCHKIIRRHARPLRYEVCYF